MRVFITLCCLLFPVHALAAHVVSVLDGDTLVVREHRNIFKVRLYGVDCPEKDQAFGLKAMNTTRRALGDQPVTLRGHSTDTYGRTVAIVELASGLTLQEVLLESGATWVYPQFCKSALHCLYWQWLEWKARWRGVGLWGQHNPVPPWQWRHKN